MPLSRDEINPVTDRRLKEIEIPEWGGSVCLRIMTCNEKDIWEHQFHGKKVTPTIIRAALVAKCLCDENGVRLYTDQQTDELGAKSCVVLDRLFDICMKSNRFSKEDVDELAKNS
jgi:hypothetical protein